MQVKTLVKKIPLSISPLEAYKRLCNNGEKPDTILLETAEVASHANHKSVIGLSSALKIIAVNSDVEIEALNDNGKAFLQNLDYSALSDFEIRVNADKVHLSFIPSQESTDEEERLKANTTLSILNVINHQLKTGLEEDDFSSYLLGAFSFDLVDRFEKLPTTEKTTEDFVFYVADELLIQDLESNSAQIIVKGFGENADNEIHLGLSIESITKKLSKASEPVINLSKTPECHKEISDADFQNQVIDAKKHIVNGDVFQLVLSRNYSIECPKPLTAYANLRSSNPSPYMYFLNFGNKQLFGASPESCLKVDREREVSLYPIAGTRKRAIVENTINHEKDAQIEYELIEDKKETAEHMMLVDLARNDLARIITNGSRKITQLKKVVKYSHVMHLVSEVKGTLKEGFDSLTAYKACSNMGTLTGAPKIKAMELIRKYEPKGRGFYGGAVVAINANDEFDSAIVIRSAVVENQVATITAGAGVVFDSVPEHEAKETDNKAQAVIKACVSAIQFGEVAA